MDDPTFLRSDGLVTAEQAARLCGVGVSTIYAWSSKGWLPISMRYGHRPVYYSLIDVAKVEASTRQRARRTPPTLPPWEIEGEPDADAEMLLRLWSSQAESMVPVPTYSLSEVSGPIVYYLSFAERVKIGTTGNPRKRFRNLPYDTLLATEPGGRAKEQERHRQFAEFRIHGEWFTPAPALLGYIATLAPHPLISRSTAQ